jgi:hypothetical protein
MNESYGYSCEVRVPGGRDTNPFIHMPAGYVALMQSGAVD